MAYTQRRTVRFEEVDFARIVYFPRLFGYCHQTFEDFFRDEVGVSYPDMLQERRVGYPAVHAESDFKAPLRFGDPVRIVMDVVKLGGRSVTCRYRLYRGETDLLCTEVRLVTVAISMDVYGPVELPSDVRAVFERHLAADP
jgi:4-hydroxybenzoyl-CoA thioesterase